MQILEQNKKQGQITVRVEDLNDLWTLYNVISKGDHVESLTQRRVVMKEGSTGERKVMKLTLDVENVAFHEFSNRLRIKGRILEGPNDFVSYGSYHTFNLEINQNIKIIKETWLRHELKRLSESSKFKSAFVILFVAIETGLANIALITNYSQTKIASVHKNIPGKRYEQSFRKKFLKDFFDDIKTVVEANVENKDVNLIIVCGPGNVKDRFISYLKENSNEDYLKNIKGCHASSGTESAIYETLKSEELANMKKEMKLTQEARKIEEIMEQLGQDADYVVIGMKEVSTAAQMGAIKQLLVADTLIRGSSKEFKLKIEEIINNVENTGGNVDILNTNHPAGERLEDLGSLVGLLRYKF
ncbi:MAG: mRNA surveillance protein pelota [Candidatus Lokiarchaeota archaeon]|nr:mRNA surveillance protein pelota [Candidatus Lokiarchaeota archaeon]MBD3200014.1 mRNA surveillance protein pelota [Candidatus Lokiarchaeota archaeon]